MAEQFLNGANIVAVFEQTRVMLLLRATTPFKPLALSGGILYPARAKKIALSLARLSSLSQLAIDNYQFTIVNCEF